MISQGAVVHIHDLKETLRLFDGDAQQASSIVDTSRVDEVDDRRVRCQYVRRAAELFVSFWSELRPADNHISDPKVVDDMISKLNTIEITSKRRHGSPPTLH